MRAKSGNSFFVFLFLGFGLFVCLFLLFKIEFLCAVLAVLELCRPGWPWTLKSQLKACTTTARRVKSSFYSLKGSPRHPNVYHFAKT